MKKVFFYIIDYIEIKSRSDQTFLFFFRNAYLWDSGCAYRTVIYHYRFAKRSCKLWLIQKKSMPTSGILRTPLIIPSNERPISHEWFIIFNIIFHFRVWLTTESNINFPIGLLQMSLKFTNEPPQGIRASLKRTYADVTQDTLDYSNHPSWPSLLYSVAFLHTVVQVK